MSATSDIFISYSSNDASVAFGLADRLKRRGITVWIDKEGIGGATSWSKEIAEAILSCKAFLVLLSNDSVKSEHVGREVIIAAEREKTIIPVDLERVELPANLLYPLAGIQRIHHTNDDLLLRTLARFGIAASKDSSIDETAAGPAFSPLPPDPLGRKSLAVLPFENLSSETDDRWFAEGLTHELINVLSQIKTLRVKDRKSVGSYNAAGKPLARIGDELGVEFILEGTVRKSGDKVRVTAELIDIKHDDHLWSDTFKGTLEDIFDLQETIATGIAQALKLSLTLEEKSSVGKRLTDDVGAYEAYVKAEAIVSHSFTEFEEVLRYANEALALDPRLTEAWEMKARALNGMVMNLGFPLRFAEEAREAAMTALKYYPHSAHAFIECAYAEALLGKRGEALRARARAIELAPNDAFVWMKAGITHSILGDYRAAMADHEHGRRIRPDDVGILTNATLTAFALGDHSLVSSLVESSRPYIEREIALHPGDVSYLAMAIWGLAVTGRKEEARARATPLLTPPDDQYSTAMCVAALFSCDMIDEGFEVALSATGVVTMVRYSAGFPVKDSVRNDPRFLLLQERMQQEMAELAER
jgi:TolB-like protein